MIYFACCSLNYLGNSHLVHGRARLVVERRVRVVRVGGGDAEDAEPGAALAGVLRAVVTKACRGGESIID